MASSNAYPKISVVTPSLNQARFLRDTLDSVHEQGYPNLEHIVVDGGSSDGSVALIEEYADRLAFWVSEPDGGQTEALIKGFRRATGDILCWLNADDLFMPYTLHEVGGYFRSRSDTRAVYGDAYWIGEDSRPIRPKCEHSFSTFIWLNDHNFIPQPSMFWRRDLYEEVGGLDPRFDLAMDADLWIRFAERTRIAHVRSIWSKMRRYPEQKNVRLREASDLEDESIRSRYRSKDSPRLLNLSKRLVARSMRISWKLVTGRYWVRLPTD